MDFGQRNPHRSPSCESDAWPFCADPVLFEARRSVGQAVRTTLDFLPGDAVASGVLKYIAVAKAIEGELHDTVLPELVAEARASGVSWSAIGKTLGIGDTAAQKRFGSNPTPDRGDLPPMEREVVNLTNELLTGFPYDSPDGIALMEDLGETTPQERMRYAIELIRGARNSYIAAEEELAVPPGERDEGKFQSALFAAHQKMTTLTTTIIAAPDQWEAVPSWAEQPEIPDASHYNSPVMYIFYAMRLVMLSYNYHSMALNPRIDFGEKVRIFRMARDVLEQSMMILMRKDVSSVIYKVIAVD
jgi:hypothetical protein